MAYKEIKTEILIEATAESVWKILTSYEDYQHWNPFITSIEGVVKPGDHVNINAGGMRFSPLILAVEKYKELRWKGKLWMTGLFDGEHSFIIEDHRDGTVTFRQEEKFSGILVGLFSKKLDTDTKNGFEQMNLKLKELSEALHKN